MIWRWLLGSSCRPLALGSVTRQLGYYLTFFHHHLETDKSWLVATGLMIIDGALGYSATRIRPLAAGLKPLALLSKICMFVIHFNTYHFFTNH